MFYSQAATGRIPPQAYGTSLHYTTIHGGAGSPVESVMLGWRNFSSAYIPRGGEKYSWDEDKGRHLLTYDTRFYADPAAKLYVPVKVWMDDDYVIHEVQGDIFPSS